MEAARPGAGKPARTLLMFLASAAVVERRGGELVKTSTLLGKARRCERYRRSSTIYGGIKNVIIDGQGRMERS
jgi:hypothetical protein